MIDRKQKDLMGPFKENHEKIIKKSWVQFLQKGSSDFFGFSHFELREAQTLKPYMGFQ